MENNPEIERLNKLVSNLSSELLRVRTAENVAAVELEKIRSLLGVDRSGEVTVYEAVLKIWRNQHENKFGYWE
jgi:PP-loop superfamily ATP-utilizing enzyme